MNTERTTKMAAVRINPLGFVALFIVFVVVLLYYMTPATDTGSWLSSRKGRTIDLKHLLSVAIEVAESGGKQVKIVREGTSLGETSKGKTKEGVNDPLTLGDKFSHKHMFYGLKKAYPFLTVISEEKDDKGLDLSDVVMPDVDHIPQDIVRALRGTPDDNEVSSDQLTVWIDPLDATKEYTEGLLQYVTTMVCVARNGRPIIGVVHKPFEKFTAWAWVDHGHSANLDDAAKLKTDKSNSDEVVKVIVSLSHAGDAKKVVDEAFGEGKAEVVGAAGAGYKALEVAQGKVTAYTHVTAIKKWDICAGDAILRSLGGKMTTLKGDTISYGVEGDVKNTEGLLATYTTDHEDLRKKLYKANHDF